MREFGLIAVSTKFQSKACHIEEVVTDVELADSKGIARKVHNMAKLLREKKADIITYN